MFKLQTKQPLSNKKNTLIFLLWVWARGNWGCTFSSIKMGNWTKSNMRGHQNKTRYLYGSETDTHGQATLIMFSVEVLAKWFWDIVIAIISTQTNMEIYEMCRITWTIMFPHSFLTANVILSKIVIVDSFNAKLAARQDIRPSLRNGHSYNNYLVGCGAKGWKLCQSNKYIVCKCLHDCACICKYINMYNYIYIYTVLYNSIFICTYI